MNLNKKGISPLIATVLVIGFTIVLATLVIQWGGGLFRDVQERTGVTAELNEKCSTQLVNLDVSPARRTKNTDDYVFTIDNLNQINVKKFDFRFYKTDGDAVLVQWDTQVLDTSKIKPLEELTTGAQKRYTVNPGLDIVTATSAQRASIFPYIELSSGEVQRCSQEFGLKKVVEVDASAPS